MPPPRSDSSFLARRTSYFSWCFFKAVEIL